jgi:hypothetical protein
MRFVALIVLAAAISAVEPVVADWRCAVEARPTAVTVAWRDGEVSRSGTDSLDSAWGLAVGGRLGLGRPGRAQLVILGLDAVTVEESLPGGDRRAVLGRAGVGYGVAVDAAWLLSLTASAAWGPGRMSLAGPGTSRVAMSGSMAEVDLRSAVRWHFAGCWSVDTEAGWMLGHDRFAGDGATWTGDRSGPVFAIGLAWTPDPRPRGLE